MATQQTLLEALVHRLRACKVSNDAEVDPVAILWTDPRSEWKPLLPQLRQQLPELCSLGSYAPEERQGPALWLRCIVDRTLPELAIPEDRLPILYLPGVSRQDLRAGEGCPWVWEPLIELMFRGTLWLQRNGRDWTLQAFFGSADALGLDLAADQATRAALSRALTELAILPLEPFRGTRLEAKDFDALLADDPIRDLLHWMEDPQAFQQARTPERWQALCSIWRQDLRFDPARSSALTAAEQLVQGGGIWERVWQRFADSPVAFPGIPNCLRQAAPQQLGLNVSAQAQHLERWPHHNDNQERQVLEALQQLPKLSHAQACRLVRELEEQHRERRQWIWAQLDLSPMAQLLEPLSRLAQRASTPLQGVSPDEFATAYTTDGWEADRCAWQAVAIAPLQHEAVVQAAVGVLLRPWLDETAQRFQQVVSTAGLPTPHAQPVLSADPGGCLFFADGLRYDIGRLLQQSLEAMGLTATLTTRWAALPSVTATAKPAVTPLIDRIQGQTLPEDFSPSFTTGKPTSAGELRKALQAEGYTILTDDDLNLPAGPEARGWLESGELDKRGHQLQDELPRSITAEIDRLALRIQQLLELGWTSVRVVTDHGWLYCPGGLPGAELPRHLTASRWSRCAVISGDSQVSAPTVPWSWNDTQYFATPTGAASFPSGSASSYAHGGISLQECLTPVLEVTRSGAGGASASISAITWRGQRCFVEVNGSSAGLQVDLRRQDPQGPSVVTALKPVDHGAASLLVEDDDLETTPLMVVLLGPDQRILAQQRTQMGVDL